MENMDMNRYDDVHAPHTLPHHQDTKPFISLAQRYASCTYRLTPEHKVSWTSFVAMKRAI